MRVVPHGLCLTGAEGLAIWQQLNRGSVDRAVQAGWPAPGESAAWWSALEHAAGTGTFCAASPGFIVAGHKA